MELHNRPKRRTSGGRLLPKSMTRYCDLAKRIAVCKLNAISWQTHWRKRAACFAGARVRTDSLIFTLMRITNHVEAQTRASPTERCEDCA